MDERFRRWFTAVEENGVMGSLEARELLKPIGRAFGKPSSSIYFWWLRMVGFAAAPLLRTQG